MRRRILRSLGFSVLIAGCTVGPDYEAPEPAIPDAWQSAAAADLTSEAPPIAYWWEAFNDPVLDDLILRAAENNKGVVAAAGRIEEARAIRGVARSPLFPDLILGGSYARTQASENSPAGQIQEATGGSVEPADLYSGSFDSFWEIDLWGRIRRGLEAADAELDASMEDYRDVLVSLYAEVASAYVDVRTAQTRIRFAAQNVESQRESVQLTRDRFRAGLTSALDVAQAESNLLSSEAQIPLLETQLEVALNRVAVLLGENPGSVHGLLGGSGAIPEPDYRVAEMLPAELLRRRPDVRAAERRLAAQTARVGQRTAELYPSFSLSGFLELVSIDAGDFFSSESVGWGFIPGVRWNLFAGGRIRSQIRVEEARTVQLLAAYEQQVLLALSEAENALVAMERSRVREERLTDAVTATERSVDLVRTQYLSGLTNFQNVLDSQRSLFNQQDQLAATQGAAVQSLIALNKALGGGWDPDAVDTGQVQTASSEQASGGAR
jgi:NodT family efflux transporter outer membrane factor (OMF) lipoprotein